MEDNQVIDRFKEIAYKAASLSDDLQDSDMMSGPAQKLVDLIHNHPELRNQFVECIKIFIGLPWIDRTKPPIPSIGVLTAGELNYILLYVLQWEELYLHVEYLITLIDPLILYPGLLSYRSCFYEPEDMDLYESFDFETARKNIDENWKSKYEQLNK